MSNVYCLSTYRHYKVSIKKEPLVSAYDTVRERKAQKEGKYEDYFRKRKNKEILQMMGVLNAATE